MQIQTKPNKFSDRFTEQNMNNRVIIYCDSELLVCCKMETQHSAILLVISTFCRLYHLANKSIIIIIIILYMKATYLRPGAKPSGAELRSDLLLLQVLLMSE